MLIMDRLHRPDRPHRVTAFKTPHKASSQDRIRKGIATRHETTQRGKKDTWDPREAQKAEGSSVMIRAVAHFLGLSNYIDKSYAKRGFHE